MPQTLRYRPAHGQNEAGRMGAAELRGAYLLEDLFRAGSIELVYWETDRAVIGSAVPTGEALTLETATELKSAFFCERRELGVLNLGAPGTVTAGGRAYNMGSLDCLYVSRGTADVSFSSAEAAEPARFYLVSYPAHVAHPTTLATRESARQIQLGQTETANKRTIFQYIHEEGIKSCQLVMGFTQLDTGSVWNTIPPHTHLRRSEAYLYFNLPADGAVFHLMGPGSDTRHLAIHNLQGVLSPPWSIHSGCGTGAYSFVWAMGGENQAFTDMDGIAVRELR